MSSNTYFVYPPVYLFLAVLVLVEEHKACTGTLFLTLLSWR